MTEPTLPDLVEEFVAAPSWAASERLVEAQPRLLSDAADQILSELIGAAEVDGRVATAHRYEAHRALLRACRTEGVAAAFRTLMLVGVPEGLRERWLVAAHASDRYQHGGDEADLDAADRALTALVEDPRFGEAPGAARALMAYALGTALIDRHMVEGWPTDLNRAVIAFRVAVDAAPQDDPERPDYLAALGNALAMRHDMRGNVDDDSTDLRASIAALDEVAHRLDDGDERLPGRLGELAASHAALYDATGEAEHLAAAIDMAQRAVRTADRRPELADLPALLNNLVNSLMSRYECSGGLDDLRAAVGHARRAVELGTAANYLPELLATLGGVLLLLYDRDRHPQTLDQAIDVLDQARASLPAGSPQRAVCLANLGNARLTRFEVTHRESDLNAAYRGFTAALDDVDPNVPRAALLSGGLGLALLHLYALHGAEANLRGAVSALESAVRLAAGAARILPFLLSILAAAYRHEYEHDADTAQLAAGVHAYREACARGRHTQLELALTVGADWGRWAARRASWDEAAVAFGGAMEAAELLFRTQFDRADKEIWLAATTGLAADAAYAHARSGGPDDAVIAIESGRAQLLSEALHPDLAYRAPELATRLRACRERLRQLRWQPPPWSWSADLDEA